MDTFAIIEDGIVILRSRGVYYQRKVYKRGDRIYAQHGGGFIRLGANGYTSTPNVTYESLDLPFEPARGKALEPLVPRLQLVQGQARA